MKFPLIAQPLTHHAHYIVGGENAHTHLIVHLEDAHSIRVQGNPDFFNRAYDTFSIDNARDIIEFHQSMPTNASAKKIFVIRMNGITSEAQNALLKLLEEPHHASHFFLILPSAHLLLPTVRSRMVFVGKEENSLDEEAIREAKKFLKAAPPERLKIVQALTEAISKEKKKKQDAINFLDAVQEIIHKEKGVTEGRDALNVISHARTYMNDRAPSIKMLLEYVAINL